MAALDSIAVLSTVIILIACGLASAAASYTEYNPYRYDLIVPQFTPDGRLLQVEYAQRAVEHSNPIVAVRLVPEDILVLMCCRRSHSPQERIILSNNNAIIAMAGVLADNLKLISIVREHLTNEFWRYGGTKKPSAIRIAELIADVCRQTNSEGGLRPLGATMWVILVADEPKSDKIRGRNNIVLYRTDPSGSVLTIPLQNVAVLGGTSASAANLAHQITTQLEQETNQSTKKKLRNIWSILQSDFRKSHDERDPAYLEVLLSSPSKGTIKLTSEQITALFDGQ
jgi:20S proteasome alpha/beta subunit